MAMAARVAASHLVEGAVASVLHVVLGPDRSLPGPKGLGPVPVTDVGVGRGP
jgi:hypothetical protein